MKAVYVDDAYTVEVKDVEQQPLKDNDVKIEVEVAGICGSDINTYKGIHPFRKPPVIIGHEVAGRVVEVGKKVTRIKVGDRVTVEPQEGCGTCEACLRGETNYCSDRRAPGINDWYGTMAEYFVAPETSVLVLPDSLSYRQGALAEPLAVCVHAVEKAGIRPGDKVAVVGVGPIGLLTLAVTKSAGATTILATDIMDYSLETATTFGATHTLNTKDNTKWTEDAKEIVEGPFDKVLIAAGVPGIINDSLDLLKRGGKMVTIAMFNQSQNVDIAQLQNQEKEVIGSFCYTYKDMQNAVNLLANHDVSDEHIVSHVLPYEEAAKGFELVEKKLENSLKVLIEFK